MPFCLADKFKLVKHKMDNDVLLLESKFCKPGREIYSRLGTCSIVAEFDGRTLHIFYSNHFEFLDYTPWREFLYAENEDGCIHRNMLLRPRLHSEM